MAPKEGNIRPSLALLFDALIAIKTRKISKIVQAEISDLENFYQYLRRAAF